MALNRKSQNIIHTTIGLALMALLVLFIARDEPIYHVIPNLLMFTPWRYKCPEWWRDPFEYLPKEPQAHQPIPEIAADDYSYEKLRTVTRNFRVPVVIRGLFRDTPAVRHWHRPGYLGNKTPLGDHEIAIMRKGNPYEQQDRYIDLFRHGVNDVLKNPKSTTTLFFPVLSRMQFNTTARANTMQLQKDVNDIVRKDLMTDRIWPGFGTEQHRSFHATQLAIGRGGSTPGANYTGLAWHSEPGTNWFAQVHGGKRWYFLAPQDSPLLLPKPESLNSIATYNMRRMEELHERLPLRYVDMKAGDLLYNPDWEWHHTRNEPGLSIGVPMREVNVYYSFRNNPWYMLVTLRNHLLGGV